MRSYDFQPQIYRAQCLAVVDSCTCDLFMDLGFREYARHRVSLYGIDVPLQLTSVTSPDDVIERMNAIEAKEWLKDMLRPTQVSAAVLLCNWPLRVQTYNDTAHLGHWLVDIWAWDRQLEGEVHVNAKMIELGLAKLLTPKL